MLTCPWTCGSQVLFCKGKVFQPLPQDLLSITHIPVPQNLYYCFDICDTLVSSTRFHQNYTVPQVTSLKIGVSNHVVGIFLTNQKNDLQNSLTGNNTKCQQATCSNLMLKLTAILDFNKRSPLNY